MKHLLIVILAMSLSACISTGSGRYSQKYDSAPLYVPDRIQPETIVPEYVEYAPANSRPYIVLGEYYEPIATGLGYEAKGEASWYGQKFHGHKTANGEIYDMYEFTAAHKTLPLPSFVRVTNLRNDKQIVVRVNDRGPFHNNRLIDLSYAAAYKLDMLKTGTTQVKLEVIHVAKTGAMHIGKRSFPKSERQQLAKQTPVTTPEVERLYIQVAALQDYNKAGELAKGLASLYQMPTHTPETNGIFRLRMGPFDDPNHSKKLLEELKSNGYEGAYEIYALD